MILLKLLSKIYLFVINRINSYYDKFPPKSVSFPVICVGGIRAGGSGKTPLTDWVIGKVIEAGKTPVLFSRGYKRKSTQTEIVPPDCETSWQAVGDEPLMLKNHHKELWLAIDANRKRAEKKLRTFGLKNIVGIMDDGFQHRKFPRDLDIVIITPNDLTDEVLPLGRLRESIKSLDRADVVVSTKHNEELGIRNAELKDKLCFVNFVSLEFVNAVSGERKTAFDGDILAICGIARPQRFIESVESLTKKNCETLIFSDHHRYTDSDYKKLNSASQAVLVTTEKDFVRFDIKKTENPKKLWYLYYIVSIDAESEKFLSDKILEVCRSRNE